MKWHNLWTIPWERFCHVPSFEKTNKGSLNSYFKVPSQLSISPLNTFIQLFQGSGLNVNRYATKKTLSQGEWERKLWSPISEELFITLSFPGMLDIALLTSNAAHLKYVLSVRTERMPISWESFCCITMLLLNFPWWNVSLKSCQQFSERTHQ